MLSTHSSPDEASSTLQQSTMRVVMQHPQEVQRLMQEQGANAQTAMRDMGQRMAVILAKDCPLAMTLFARAAGSTGPAGPLDLNASPEEQPLLDRIARSICADISAQEVKKPLAQLPKADRLALVQQIMVKHMKANAKELSKLYGPDFLQDAERVRTMGAKVGALAARHCSAQMTTLMQP